MDNDNKIFHIVQSTRIRIVLTLYRDEKIGICHSRY